MRKQTPPKTRKVQETQPPSHKSQFPGPFPIRTHLDLCRENMLLSPDGKTLFILDWEAVGYHPRSFQLAALQYLRDSHGGRGEAGFQREVLRPFDGGAGFKNGGSYYAASGIESVEEEETCLVRLVHAASVEYMCE